MSTDLTSTLDPAVLEGFAARGVSPQDAADLIGYAQGELTPAELHLAMEALVQTRLLTWPECVRYAKLRQPLI